MHSNLHPKSAGPSRGNPNYRQVVGLVVLGDEVIVLVVQLDVDVAAVPVAGADQHVFPSAAELNREKVRAVVVQVVDPEIVGRDECASFKFGLHAAKLRRDLRLKLSLSRGEAGRQKNEGRDREVISKSCFHDLSPFMFSVLSSRLPPAPTFYSPSHSSFSEVFVFLKNFFFVRGKGD